MLHELLKRLIWVCIKSLVSTYRITILETQCRDKARTIHPKGSFIFAVWHEQVVSVMSGHALTEPYLALSSRSKDGDYAAFVSEKMGFVAVRGSSRKKNVDKGGKEVLKEYISKLGEGISGGLTVDGPKGPRQKCKIGAVLMSQESGAPILPVIGLASSYWEFNSWDRFKIPKPFAKIRMIYGEPISIAKDATPEELERACDQVTDALQNLEKKFSNLK